MRELRTTRPSRLHMVLYWCIHMYGVHGSVVSKALPRPAVPMGEEKAEDSVLPRRDESAAAHGIGRANAMHYHNGRPWKEGRRSRLRLRQCLCVGLPCSCPPRARTHGGPLQLVRPGSASRSSSAGAGDRGRRRGEARRGSRDWGGFGRRRGSGRCMRRVGAWALEQERA